MPYLKATTDKRYTLVLDLDETLVHYNEVAAAQSARSRTSCVVEDDGGGFFRIRPYAREFLAQMSDYYELVIFTCGMQDYADWVLDNLDHERKIDARLYRQHAEREGTLFVKGLSKLGRDLKRVIIVDNLAQNFSRQSENGILIRSWFDDKEDRAL